MDKKEDGKLMGKMKLKKRRTVQRLISLFPGRKQIVLLPGFLL